MQGYNIKKIILIYNIKGIMTHVNIEINNDFDSYYIKIEPRLLVLKSMP